MEAWKLMNALNHFCNTYKIFIMVRCARYNNVYFELRYDDKCKEINWNFMNEDAVVFLERLKSEVKKFKEDIC